MRKSVVLVWFVILTALGVCVIALPDRGPRVAFSADHGPGLLDAAGILLLLLGSAALWWYVWRSRNSLTAAPKRLRTLWTFAAGLGLGLVLASVVNDFSAWWAVGAGILSLVQFSLFLMGTEPRRT
ncbi:MAG TPA: hypothetical protein DGT23_28855 [Micromonosporaceae bacterium]|nr:hypothetical protein [Micromonosporaceae bacterium]